MRDCVEEAGPRSANYKDMSYRETVETLTDPMAAGDALTRHYLLAHPASLSRRTVLPGGRGVAAICRTSAGPLPLVVFRCSREEDIPDLLAASLDPVAKHYFITRSDYRTALLSSIRGVADEEDTLIHTLRRHGPTGGHQPTTTLRPDVWPPQVRLETGTHTDSLTGATLYFSRVLLRGREVSSARAQWSSGGYAEIGVSTESEYRRLGYGKAATRALAGLLAGIGVTPLYIADRLNSASLALAASVGFEPTGDREFACSGFRL